MAWIRLDDQIAHHPKFLRSGPVCGWFFVCSLGFCQKFLTDGFIPDEAISTLANVEHPRRCAESLVKAGLFERDDKGFRIHDYLKYNESAVVVKARREHDRIRKDASRNPSGRQPESSGGPVASRARIPSHPILKKEQKIKAVALPLQNIGIITKFAHEARASNGHSTDADLEEAIKVLCATRHVAYDSEAVQKAMESSAVQQKHRKAAR